MGGTSPAMTDMEHLFLGIALVGRHNTTLALIILLSSAIKRSDASGRTVRISREIPSARSN